MAWRRRAWAPWCSSARSTPSACRCSRSTGPMLRGTPMSERSTPPPHESTSSAEVFRAPTLAMPASERASRGSSPDSGPSSLVPLAFYDPASSSWRMSGLSLFEASTEFSETFPRSGTMRSGRVYEHPTWARLIEESAFSSSRGDESSWPTPMSYSHGENCNAPGQTKLDIVVLGRYPDNTRYWPTATAGDSKSSGSRNLAGSKAHPGVSLTDAVTTGGSTTPRSTSSTATAGTRLFDEASMSDVPAVARSAQAPSLTLEPRRWPTPRAHEALPGDCRLPAISGGCPPIRERS